MKLLPLYIFIDEAGDFNFTPTGTKFYTISALVTYTPYSFVNEIEVLKHKILVGDICKINDLKYLEKNVCDKFHACEDKQVVRNEVFKIISKFNSNLKFHSIVVKKNKTNPSIRSEEIFYPKVTSSLLAHIYHKYQFSKLCILISGKPVSKKKSIFLKSIKAEIKAKCHNTEFNVFFPSPSSDICLQICDYVNWAIFKKWEKNDMRSYDQVRHLLGSVEFDIFAKGDMEYYRFKD